MEKYKASNQNTDKLLEDFDTNLESRFSDLREKGDELIRRQLKLKQRELYLSEIHGGNDSKDSDIININAGGSIFSCTRGILTAIKESRLGALFSRRWENLLLRDEEGKVFIDVNPIIIEEIIGYLHMKKISYCDELLHKLLTKNLKKSSYLNFYMTFFGICNQGQENEFFADTDSVSGSNIGAYKALINAFLEEERLPKDLEMNLEQKERNLNDEESMITLFTSESDKQTFDNSDSIQDNSIDSATSQGFSDIYKRDYSIIKLKFHHETISVRRSTLCLCKNSLLRKNFSDVECIEQNSCNSSSGSTPVVLMEYPASIVSTPTSIFEV